MKKNPVGDGQETISFGLDGSGASGNPWGSGTGSGFSDCRQRAKEGHGTWHCASGSLWRMYAWEGCEIDEDTLLGLGEGVGFIYWHQKGALPMLGGRAMPKEGMETLAARRTGVALEVFSSSSPVRARQSLVACLARNQTMMLQVDMGNLPYFDFGPDYHFGGHVVLACGYEAESETVLVADREERFHLVPMADLSRARSSTFKPFPPGNRAWSGDFSGFHPPGSPQLREALQNQAHLMLNPPIANIGCRGISTAARRLGRWTKDLPPEEVQAALFNLWIFASETGGSGGGLFRHMLSRYTASCARACGSEVLAEAADGFSQAGRLWDQVADLARQAAGDWGRPGTPKPPVPDPSLLDSACTGLSDILEQIAGVETRAWGLCLAP